VKAILSNGICGEKIFKQKGEIQRRGKYTFIDCEAFKFGPFEEGLLTLTLRKGTS
jgi:hypothetical protein